jgi:hypothetical protein
MDNPLLAHPALSLAISDVKKGRRPNGGWVVCLRHRLLISLGLNKFHRRVSGDELMQLKEQDSGGRR